MLVVWWCCVKVLSLRKGFTHACFPTNVATLSLALPCNFIIIISYNHSHCLSFLLLCLLVFFFMFADCWFRLKSVPSFLSFPVSERILPVASGLESSRTILNMRRIFSVLSFATIAAALNCSVPPIPVTNAYLDTLTTCDTVPGDIVFGYACEGTASCSNEMPTAQGASLLIV